MCLSKACVACARIYMRTRYNSRFLGAVVGGSINVDGKLNKSTKVGFEWHAEGPGFDERRRMDRRCDHACERWVP